MRSGYDIFWTATAKSEFKRTFEYLSQNFTEKEIERLALKIESITELISKNPILFPKSEFRDIHKVIILKFNTLYYQLKSERIEILSFFSNRQSPKKRKL